MALTKPRIIELLLITTVPVMFLAEQGVPDLKLVLLTCVGGYLSAGGANALNMYIDRDIDALMDRTSQRPLVTGLANLAEAVHGAAANAVAFTSVAGVRHGLALAPEPPGAGEVRGAAARWLTGREVGGELSDPVLLRHLLWIAVASGLPLQLHAGLGEPGLRIDRTDPVLLTDFVRATAGLGTDLILLHGYPYHRHAAHLAGVFPHVYADSGAALVGPAPGRRRSSRRSWSWPPSARSCSPAAPRDCPSCTSSPPGCSARPSAGCWAPGWPRGRGRSETRSGWRE
ncbi:Protoheme IX farnesyltransferase [Streptomyces tendae]